MGKKKSATEINEFALAVLEKAMDDITYGDIPPAFSPTHVIVEGTKEVPVMLDGNEAFTAIEWYSNDMSKWTCLNGEWLYNDCQPSFNFQVHTIH